MGVPRSGHARGQAAPAGGHDGAGSADAPPEAEAQGEDSRDRGPARRSSPDRRLTITLLASLGLHVAAATALVLLLRGGGPPPDLPGKPAEVELVMEERAGEARSSPPPAPEAQPRPEAKAASMPPDAPPQADKAEPSPATPPPIEASPNAPEETAEPVRQSEPARPKAANTAPAPVPDAPARDASPAPNSPSTETPVREARSVPEQPRASPPPAPTITLHGTDSPSDARAWGDHVIPAAPDAVFHNRPPEFPREAAENGQHGAVVVLIHISPAGTAAGVDVLSSSGYVLLDRAARDAVMRWRFLPAVKDGQPVASDMRMGFIFDYE